MGSREDDSWWDSKYAEAYCHYHDLEMHYNEDKEHFECAACAWEEGEDG